MLIGIISMSIMMIGCDNKPTVNVSEESAKLLRNAINNAWDNNGYSKIVRIVKVKDCITVNVIGNKYEGTATVVISGRTKDAKHADTHWSFETIFDGENIMIQKAHMRPEEEAELKELMKWAQMSTICGWGS